MDEKRVARLRAHQLNIERYQRLLKTRLSEVETQFLERRLSEERFWAAILDYAAPSPRGDALHGVLE
jgi:hypothetical protein